jgi:vitamin B12 transporter
MKKEKRVWAITLIVLGWLAPYKIIAQQDSLNARQLNEVVVTATKFPKSQSETGKVLTVIDEDQIRQSAGKDLTQLLNEQVGLVVNGSNSNPGKDKSVYLRGAKNDYTLILIDGIPLTDPSGVSGGAYDLRLISLDQIERIEILKGSQSTLYGSDAVAGVINIITKLSGDKPFEFLGTVDYGSYNTLRANAAVQGSTRFLNYNIGYSRMNTEGISEAAETGIGDYDKDGASQNSLQANFEVKPIESLSVKPFIRYSTFTGEFDGGSFTDDVLNKYEGQLLNTGAQVKYWVPKGSLNLLYSYDNTNRIFDGTFGKSQFEGIFNHTEIFYNHSWSERFQMLTGISNQHSKMLDQTSVEKDPSVILTSPYLSLFGHFGHFSIEIGGRYNNHSKFGSNATYSINPSYRFDSGLKIFANLTSGFKAPSLYQLYGQFGANPDLKPEQSESLEGGAQWLSDNQRIELRAVAFNRKIKDVIVYIFPTNFNLNQQNDHGIEIESSISLTSKIKMRAFYAWVTGKVTTPDASGDSTFNNLIRRPAHSAGVNLGYQVNKRFFTSFNLNAYGQRQDLYFDLNTFTTQAATLNAYLLVDVYGECRFGKQTLIFLQVRNLLNSEYQEVYGYNTMGINVSGGIKFRL